MTKLSVTDYASDCQGMNHSKSGIWTMLQSLSGSEKKSSQVGAGAYRKSMGS